MVQWIRVVLIWLVAIAIPTQGMAAAIGIHCGPGHVSTQTAQGAMQVLAEASPLASGVHEQQKHALHKHAPHKHESNAAADVNALSHDDQNANSPDASGAGQSVGAADPGKGGQSPKQKCSACASCCAGLALPSTAIMPPTIDPASVVSVLAQAMAASIFHDGPERPPRILRA